MKLNLFIELTLSADEAIKRLLKRAEIEGRIDDNPETVRDRFEEYNRKTAPVHKDECASRSHFTWGKNFPLSGP